jgi:excisionase family DNA binding protein
MTIERGMTPREAAELTSLGAQTIRAAITRGEIASYRRGRILRIHLDDVYKTLLPHRKQGQR